MQYRVEECNEGKFKGPQFKIFFEFPFLEFYPVVNPTHKPVIKNYRHTQ